MLPARVRRVVEHLLPWYDPIVEARRHAWTEAISRRSIAARIEAEHATDRVRTAYQRYADVVDRR